jgi:23S rRNA (guanosine2251-2'-O)-methyltransferase
MRFSPRFLQLLREAKSGGVLVEEVTWARLGQISGGAVHQGIVLQPAAAETLDLPSLIEGCRSTGEAPLLIAVDGLTDPQNLGAIVRSAEALGAHGLVLPQRRNAGLTGSVAKVAAGALEHLPVARVVNLNRSLEALKDEGYRVIGLASEGSVTLEEADLDGPLVVVTGSEGDGLSLLTRKHCDQLVRIPLRGTTPSLNASVATALLLYEIARRGWMQGLRGNSPAPRLVRPALPAPPAAAAADEVAPRAEVKDVARMAAAARPAEEVVAAGEAIAAAHSEQHGPMASPAGSAEAAEPAWQAAIAADTVAPEPREPLPSPQVAPAAEGVQPESAAGLGDAPSGSDAEASALELPSEEGLLAAAASAQADPAAAAAESFGTPWSAAVEASVAPAAGPAALPLVAPLDVSSSGGAAAQDSVGAPEMAADAGLSIEGDIHL